MSKDKKEEPRYIYRKDQELSRENFSDFERAKEVETDLLKRYPEPEFRVRNRLRSRTGLWDVIVKRRTEVQS